MIQIVYVPQVEKKWKKKKKNNQEKKKKKGSTNYFLMSSSLILPPSWISKFIQGQIKFLFLKEVLKVGGEVLLLKKLFFFSLD